VCEEIQVWPRVMATGGGGAAIGYDRLLGLHSSFQV